MDSLGESPNALHTWTVYSSPRDYPGRYVIRRFSIRSGSDPIPDENVWATAGDLELVRCCLPSGLFRIDRSEADDPTIVETWI